MPTEKEIKKIFLEKTAKNPDAFYPTDTFRALHFHRAQCTSCRRHFWNQDKSRTVCGDAPCQGGFTFIGNSPATKKLDYISAWTEFSRIHQELGYTPVKRYPVVSRWNPTTDFTIASIAAFQPFVVSGEVDPPANPLVIPQFCVRFTDIDNVGITGHHVGFVMLGQHTFVAPNAYDINAYVSHHLTWLQNGMGLHLEHITIHEEFWAGGGNFGPAVEFFSGGLEISNQVYMQYELTETGYKELDIKVLDMGQGQERIAWFTHGSPTAYETSFPDVITKLRALTGLAYDEHFMTRFMPHAGYLNINEVEDMDAAWTLVARKLDMPPESVKEKLLPQAALYSIAEHARALLFCLADGALPSNVGGYYNLRVILRRALTLIDKYGWNIDLCDVCTWHADYLEPLYPELKKSLPNVHKILDVEKVKYRATLEKTHELIEQYADTELTTDDLIRLYDSNGISPDALAHAAHKRGKDIKVPANFYALVAERHEHKDAHKTQRADTLDFGDAPDTQALYFDDWNVTQFDAKVLRINGDHVLLDKTAFYPVSGGQAHDTGTLSWKSASSTVIDVYKQGGYIVHVLDAPCFNEGDIVHGAITTERRKQLTQHHTSTHIVNAAAKKILGDHINQAGARKDTDKAYIDVTHYQGISDDELRAIEHESNRIIAAHIPVKKSFMPRTEAEQKYGVHIYQGGVAPGKLLRIVNIDGIDVEACGGTHLNNTAEAEQLRILGAQKVKDGVVRITFAAGNAALAAEDKEASLTHQLAELLAVEPTMIPARAEELFTKWKKARKAVQKNKPLLPADLELTSSVVTTGNIIEETCLALKTQPDHLLKVTRRFLEELHSFKNRPDAQ